MNKICFGCGAKLQSMDKNKIGYIPESKSDASYCMRCFRLMHYGENVNVATPKEAKEIINKINKDVRFVIFLVDFLNINESVIKIFKSIKKRKVLVINKCELMPTNISKEKFALDIKNYYNIKDDVKIKGGKGNHGAKSIYNYLADRDIHEAYILGLTNSGKSTLINDLIKLCESKVNKTTVNNKKNTTVDFIRVRLNDDLTLIDSPGFVLDNMLERDNQSKNITAYSMNMKECETVVIDKEFYLKFDAPTPIVLYTNLKNEKPIKKYFKAADGLIHNITIDSSNTDLIIRGIGFIRIKNKVNISTNIKPSFYEVRSGQDE